MTLPDDFREFLRLLVVHEVEFMVVGGHAVSHHGYPRFTHDVDVVVRPTLENSERFVQAPTDFGFGALGLSADEFTRDATTVLGRAPYEIDIMTFMKGVDLTEAWARRSWGVPEPACRCNQIAYKARLWSVFANTQPRRPACR